MTQFFRRLMKPLLTGATASEAQANARLTYGMETHDPGSRPPARRERTSSALDRVEL